MDKVLITIESFQQSWFLTNILCVYIYIILKYTKYKYMWLSFIPTQTSKYAFIDNYILINKMNDLSTRNG